MSIGASAAKTLYARVTSCSKTATTQGAQLSKLKKIEWYAGHLVSEAAAKEKAGRLGDAIVDYLQAADLLLLLAKGQQEYTPGSRSATGRSLARRG